MRCARFALGFKSTVLQWLQMYCLFCLFCACTCWLNAGNRCDCRLGEDSDSGGERLLQPAQAQSTVNDSDAHSNARSALGRQGSAVRQVLKLTWRPDPSRPGRPLTTHYDALVYSSNPDYKLHLEVCARILHLQNSCRIASVSCVLQAIAAAISWLC